MNKQTYDEKIAETHGQLQNTLMRSLTLIGNKLADKEKYKNLSGVEAIHYYLVQKHNWFPSQVRSMTLEDLSFCLEEVRL